MADVTWSVSTAGVLVDSNGIIVGLRVAASTYNSAIAKAEQLEKVALYLAAELADTYNATEFTYRQEYADSKYVSPPEATAENVLAEAFTAIEVAR